MRKVALIGGPGVDLLSPAQVLAEATGLGVISAGNLMREHWQLRSPVGEQMRQYIRAGEFLPDESMTDAIAEALAKLDGGWVLCGYPRTIAQADFLAQRGHEPDTVIELILTEDEYGLTVRRQIELDPQRAERRPELLLLLLRHSHYQEQVEPLRDHFHARGMLRTISGFGYYEDVAARLMTIVPGR